jgi:hypothetical protein
MWQRAISAACRLYGNASSIAEYRAAMSRGGAMSSAIEAVRTDLQPQKLRESMRSPGFLVWLAVAGLLILFWIAGASPNGDFDDLMKFQKIRWFLETGTWFDQSVPGVLQPEPFFSHWPRLLDLPYAAVAWMAEPLVGLDVGLRIAAFTVPLMLLLPSLFLYRRIVGSLGFARPDVAFALATVPAVRAFFEFEPGRIDYHNVQILFLLAALALSFSRHRLASLANGALAALAMAASIEFAPFYGLLVAVFAFEFIRGADLAWHRAALFGVGLAAAAPLCYAVIVAPAAYGSARCDMYSAPHLLTLVLGGLAIAASAILGRNWRPAMRALLLIVAGGTAIAAVALSFPQCLAGPYSGMSSYLHDNWLMPILQERSLMERPAFVFSQSMVSATLQFVGAAALIVVAARDRWQNRNLVVFACFALLALVLAVLYSRNIRYLPIFAAPGILLVVARLLPGLRARGSLLATNFRDGLPSPLALLAPGLAAAGLVIAITAAMPRSAEALPATQLAGSCDLDAARADYHWPRGAHIMAPPDLAIRLLPDLPEGASVVAVPYHTAAAGLERAYRFLDPASRDPRAVLTESAATHIVVCAWPGEPSAAAEARYPFAAALMEGKAPAWLLECPTDPAAALRIYRYAAAGPLGAACPSASLASTRPAGPDQ